MHNFGTFNKWLGFALVNIASFIAMYYFEIFSMILAADITYLSVLIFGLYLLASVSIGHKTYKFCTTKKKELKRQNLNIEYYIKEELPKLGLIGTIIGLMVVIGPAFATIDPGAVASITSAIELITSGVGTALWTTISALVSSVLLGIQLMNLESEQENDT
jgi:hypothetical protein